jgi:hypothetical protein
MVNLSQPHNMAPDLNSKVLVKSATSISRHKEYRVLICQCQIICIATTSWQENLIVLFIAVVFPNRLRECSSYNFLKAEVIIAS